jgi:hypothetical protein
VFPHSRLFGFVRFREDGARTKALLGKVRQPRAGALTRVSRASAAVAPGPAARSVLIVAADDGRGASGKLFPACALTPTSGYLACSLANSLSPLAAGGSEKSSALGPIPTGSAKLPPILSLCRARPMISEVPIEGQRIVNVCTFPQISAFLGSSSFYSFPSGRLFVMSAVNRTLGAFFGLCSRKGEVARSLGR